MGTITVELLAWDELPGARGRPYGRDAVTGTSRPVTYREWVRAGAPRKARPRPAWRGVPGTAPAPKLADGRTVADALAERAALAAAGTLPAPECLDEYGRCPVCRSRRTNDYAPTVAA